MSDYAPTIDRIWESTPLGGMFHKHDPETSREAAAKKLSSIEGDKRAIVEALRKGPAGASEIARRAGMQSNVAVCRRLSELHRDEVVEHTGRKVTSQNGSSEKEHQLVSR